MNKVDVVDTIDTLNKYVAQSKAILKAVLAEDFIEEHSVYGGALWAVEDRLSEINELANTLFEEAKKPKFGNKAA